MNQKGNTLRSLIIKPLSDEKRNTINQIKKIKEANVGEIFIHYGTKKVSWGSTRRLLKSDTKDQSRRWINDKVINFYFMNYLAEMDTKQCQEGSE
jgi:Ulp1 family protease